LLSLSDLGVDADEGTKRAEAALDDGSALEAYERWIAAQGGDPSLEVLPSAPVTKELTADREGFVGEVSALGLGRIALDLGAGRRTKEDAIDHAVGIRCFAKRGDEVQPGQVLAAVYAREEDSAGRAVDEVRRLIAIADEPQPPRPIVLETLA
jgi:thymidine phosphorylase